MKPFKFLLAAALIFLPLPAESAVPKLMTYQGVLKDASGNFLTGTYSMTFRIYSASSGGSALWTETQSSVSASSGKFSVTLGSVTALNLDFGADYWLSMQVGADAEMSPRVRLTSMAYGMRSDYENNGFTQSGHDALTHKNIEGVKDNAINIGKTNFKLDAYSLASANSMGDMIMDSFNDATGIHSGASSGYAWRGSSNYDVIALAGGIDSNAKLVLHTNGTDGSSTFTDSSSGAKTMTANGNAQIDTAQSKFGGASGLFDGSGDYVSSADSADWTLGGGSGNFTLEAWVRFNSTSGEHAIASQYENLNNAWWFGYKSSSGTMRFQVSSGAVTTVLIDGSWSPSTNTWYHIALIRGWGGNANDYGITVNGTVIGTGTDSSPIPDLAGSFWAGRSANNDTLYFDGWIDEIRISNTARWTGNFTSPSAEYSSSSSSATVISNAYAEPVPPTEAIVIADETLGTGSITYSVSRDNGTTWTQVTKETTTNISSQPSGTQLKWKAVITGDAELNAIAVAV